MSGRSDEEAEDGFASKVEIVLGEMDFAIGDRKEEERKGFLSFQMIEKRKNE